MSLLQVEGAKDIALELNSLSKTFNMAGWRVGMVLGNAKLYQPNIESKKQYGFWDVLRNSKRCYCSFAIV